VVVRQKSAVQTALASFKSAGCAQTALAS
jgi:hypothetical protein